MIGEQYGRLSITGFRMERVNGKSRRLCFCRCACGVEKAIPYAALRSGATRSCGCIKRTHGASSGGDSNFTPEYKAWRAMLRRCDNPKHASWANYGGRGITVCEAWRASFVQFLQDVGPKPTLKHTLDRIDNNGNYEPGNVRWATVREQRLNTRRTRLITVDGVTKSLTEWAQEKGLRVSQLHHRLERGWLPERAISTPTGGRHIGKTTLFAEIAGERLPLAEWSTRTGIPHNVLRYRVLANWPPDRVLSPVRPKQKNGAT